LRVPIAISTRPPLRRQTPPLESRLLPALALIAGSSSTPPAVGDGEGVAAEPYFTPSSRLLAPRSVVLISLSPPSPDLLIEVVIKFLNAPDMVFAAH